MNRISDSNFKKEFSLIKQSDVQNSMDQQSVSESELNNKLIDEDDHDSDDSGEDSEDSVVGSSRIQG
jgi:hypothetical protein